MATTTIPQTQFVTLAIGATAQRMGITATELFNRLKRHGLVRRLLLDCYDTLHNYGFKTAAMALTDQSVSIDDAMVACVERLAIIMGTEGDGLPQETINGADYVVRIPMAHGVDSLNVAAAAAVAFWQLRAKE
jgi:tRNA G18 (ribose-2'-O)-methylase SpoU